MKFNPKADFTYRQKLMRICNDRGISTEKLNEIVAPMRGCSHEQKEQMAKDLIPLIESGIYDCNPRHFYHKTQWYDNIHHLHNSNDLRFETVRPIVEDMLHYCRVSENAIETIFAFLRTKESLRQMYNWLIEQGFVPDEDACIAKAEEFSSES